MQQELFKVNQPGGFKDVSQQDTTAVLSPIQGQVEEVEIDSQPGPALSAQAQSGGQAKASEK